MIEKSIRTSRGTVCYWVCEDWSPERDTLFFLPGLTADHTMFDRQLAYFNGRYNLIVWDAPLHGKSRPYTDFSFSSSAWIMLEILGEMKADNVILIGQSLGGYFAQTFIRAYTERVKAFVGIGTTPLGDYYSASDQWVLRQVEWMALLYPLNTLKKAIAKQVSATKAAFDNMMSMLAPYGKRELCRLMGIGYAAFLQENAKLQIRCPVLLLLGERDKTGKVRQYNEAWSKRTGFRLLIIKNAAHNANVDRPDAVNLAIEEFLSSEVRGRG